jgi:glycosyltransferase involved in cell wall biosynthesis
MRFVHLSAADYGGAGIATTRMHESLLALGHDSHLWVLDKRSSVAGVERIAADNRFFPMRRNLQKAWLKLSSRPDQHFQNQRLGVGVDFGSLARRLPARPDVIVVHFVSHFVNPEQIRQLSVATAAPVMWSLLDMALLTGGCHYAWDCRGYTARCGNCPALRWSGPRDASAHTWQAKAAVLRQLRGVVIAGSSKLAKQASESSLFSGWPIETLLLGVAPDQFPAVERASVRAEIGLPTDADVVFFGATRFDQRRKGMRVLYDALSLAASRLPQGRALPTLLAAGETDDFGGLRDKGYQVIDLGRVDMRQLARCYAAADVFACPSIEDSGPMMINESMMCGTPVLAFRMGVAEDLIQEGVTGSIAPLGDASAFADQLLDMLSWDNARRAAARRACRETALSKCTPATQLARFVDIADRLVSGGYGNV